MVRTSGREKSGLTPIAFSASERTGKAVKRLLTTLLRRLLIGDVDEAAGLAPPERGVVAVGA